MSRSNTHRILAVMAVLVVVLSFVGAPIAAAGAANGDGAGSPLGDDDSESEDDSDSGNGVGNSFGDDNESNDSNGSDDSDDDSSDDSESNDDSSENDPDGDQSPDKNGDDEQVEGENADEEVPDATDDAVDATDGVVDATADTTDRSASAGESVLDGAADTVEGAAGDTAETVRESIAGLLTQGEEVESSENPAVEATGRSSGGAKTDDFSGERSASGDGDDGSAFAAIESSGRPVPVGAPGVGVGAVGIGALAVVAMLKNTPILAGIGAGSGGSALAGSDGLVGSLLDKLTPFFFPLRYSRYDDSDPLDHQARERVFEVIDETPGSYLSEVSERADLPLSTTRHHIKILEREDLVSGAKLRGKRRFYPAYAKGVELAAALNDESTASIIDAMARLGTASVSDLADDLGRDPSTISHHLQRLEEDEIIVRERDGRAVVNKLSPEARSALEPETTSSPASAEEPLVSSAD